MKIISIHIYKCFGEEPILLGATYEVGFVGYFQRGTLKEFINFNSRTVVGYYIKLYRRTQKEERLEIALEKGVCFSYVSSECTGVTIITDEEYPRRVATELILKIIDNLNGYIYQNKINLQTINKDTDIKFAFIEEIIKNWQNPSDSNLFIHNRR